MVPFAERRPAYRSDRCRQNVNSAPPPPTVKAKTPPPTLIAHGRRLGAHVWL